MVNSLLPSMASTIVILPYPWKKILRHCLYLCYRVYILHIQPTPPSPSLNQALQPTNLCVLVHLQLSTTSLVDAWEISKLTNQTAIQFSSTTKIETFIEVRMYFFLSFTQWYIKIQKEANVKTDSMKWLVYVSSQLPFSVPTPPPTVL